MKLFIVMLVMNHIVGVMGPVPFGSTECRARAQVMQLQCDHAGSNCPPGIRFLCQWSEKSPVPGTPEKDALASSPQKRYAPS